MTTTAQDHNWQAAGYPPEEADEWRAAGVTTAVEAWEWRVGGYRATDPELAALVEGEWDLAGIAILEPTYVDEDDPDLIIISFGAGAIYRAARVVWARQRGCRNDVDTGHLMAELIRSHPDVDIAWWQWAISTAVRHAERIECEGGRDDRADAGRSRRRTTEAGARGRRFGASQVAALEAIETAGDAGISLVGALYGRGFDRLWTSSYLRHLEAAIARHNTGTCPANCPLVDEVSIVEARGPRGGQRWKVTDRGALDRAQRLTVPVPA